MPKGWGSVVRVERRSIAPRNEIAFAVPCPPSVNALYLNVPGKGRVKTRRYRDWIKEAGLMVMASRVGCIDGPVKVDIALPQSMRGDTDGRIKALLDLAVRLGLIEDDKGKIVRELTIGYAARVDALVTIRRAA